MEQRWFFATTDAATHNATTPDFHSTDFTGDTTGCGIEAYS
jgi:hypothetical protein